MVEDTDGDTINLDDEESLKNGESTMDLDTILDDEETDYDDIENENKKFLDKDTKL